MILNFSIYSVLCLQVFILFTCVTVYMCLLFTYVIVSRCLYCLQVFTGVYKFLHCLQVVTYCLQMFILFIGVYPLLTGVFILFTSVYQLFTDVYILFTCVFILFLGEPTEASRLVLKLMGSYLAFAFTGFVLIIFFLDKIGAKIDPEKTCLEVCVCLVYDNYVHMQVMQKKNFC